MAPLTANHNHDNQTTACKKEMGIKLKDEVCDGILLTAVPIGQGTELNRTEKQYMHEFTLLFSLQ